jgi:hypothetical protein
VDANRLLNNNNNKNTSRTQTSITSFNQLPTFTRANRLLTDKFYIDLTKYDKNKNSKKNKNQIIELLLEDKICIINPSSNLVCDTIVRGILPKRHDGLESPIVYVLVTDNKFNFYKITEIANNQYQILNRSFRKCNSKKNIYNLSIGTFLIKELEKDLEKYKTKLVVITGDFFLSDSQITKEDKDWLYPQMIKAIKKV